MVACRQFPEMDSRSVGADTWKSTSSARGRPPLHNCEVGAE